MDETYRPVKGLQAWAFRSDDERAAIFELERMSDRSAAIVAAALLEGHVDAVLKQELTGGDEQTFRDMSKGSGPIAAFGTKIRLLYLLGLLTSQGKKDLETITKIRNVFAHDLRVITFNHDLVNNHCLNLKLVENFIVEPDSAIRDTPHDYPMTAFEGASETLKDPRSRFFLSISSYTLAFNAYPRLGNRTPYL